MCEKKEKIFSFHVWNARERRRLETSFLFCKNRYLRQRIRLLKEIGSSNGEEKRLLLYPSDDRERRPVYQSSIFIFHIYRKFYFLNFRMKTRLDTKRKTNIELKREIKFPFTSVHLPSPPPISSNIQLKDSIRPVKSRQFIKLRNRIAQHPWKHASIQQSSPRPPSSCLVSLSPAAQPAAISSQSYHSARHANTGGRGRKFFPSTSVSPPRGESKPGYSRMSVFISRLNSSEIEGRRKREGGRKREK